MSNDHQLNNDDYEALEKFTKFFLVKSAQIIVQSRLGGKRSTKSKCLCTGNEWFHLSIKDIPEITVHTKACFIDVQHLPINAPHRPFCIEISLRKVDNRTIPLETWCISFDDSISDSTQRIRFNTYTRMSILLRSLLTCTRTTPAYQLSRKQSPEQYIICYKIYSGEPTVSHLGEHYSKKTIGNIVTPIGRFVLNVAYRTHLTMPLTQNEKNPYPISPGLEIKDDYFSSFDTDHDENMEIASSSLSSPMDNLAIKKNYYQDIRSAYKIFTNIPNLSIESMESDFDNNLAPEDFIFVEIKPVFGRSDSTDDLALFIRSCQQAPMLESFIIEPSLNETINQLNNELHAFEARVEEFDQLLTTLSIVD